MAQATLEGTGATIWLATQAEREALIADLERLMPEQWEAQSLCSAWTVREVVAHMALTPNLSLRTGLPAMLVSGFNLDRANVRMARAKAKLSPAQLLNEMRRIAAGHGTPPGAKPINVLADTVIHAQDIRRPLGIPYTFPAQTLCLVADLLATDNFNVKSKRRVEGLRLEATDLDWAHGDGPVIRGPLEALIMAMAGRPVALADLSGEGVAILRNRMPEERN